MSNFFSLQTALTGLRASQTGLDVVSHNVANANTQGYTRQRVDFGARAPYASPVGPLGTGVDVQSIGRIRDDFLDRRVRVTGAEHGFQQARADLLGRTEGVLGEPDSGISGELSSVWDAFEDFSVDPSDGAARRQVVAALESFTARIRTVERGWRDLETDSAARMGAAVTEANDLLARVAQLNGTIAVAGARGAPPADLLDERDVLLDELSVGFGVGVTRNTDGTVSVSLADESGASVDLVTGTTAATLAVGGAPGYALTASSGATATTLGTPRGEFGGLRTYLTDTVSGLPEHRAALDDFVTLVADRINAQHALGTYADPDTGAATAGGPLLVLGANGPTVDPAVRDDPRLLAAATGDPVQPQDGRNAAALAALRTAVNADGRTVDGVFAAFVVSLAAATGSATRAADAETGLLVSAAGARSSVHGVSLDEEMVALVQYQRSLEAASRVMTTIDQTLDVLINRTGIVGR